MGRVLNVIAGYFGGLDLLSRIHTAYRGEDSSIVGRYRTKCLVKQTPLEINQCTCTILF